MDKLPRDQFRRSRWCATVRCARGSVRSHSEKSKLDDSGWQASCVVFQREAGGFWDESEDEENCSLLSSSDGCPVHETSCGCWEGQKNCLSWSSILHRYTGGGSCESISWYAGSVASVRFCKALKLRTDYEYITVRWKEVRYIRKHSDSPESTNIFYAAVDTHQVLVLPRARLSKQCVTILFAVPKEGLAPAPFASKKNM